MGPALDEISGGFMPNFHPVGTSTVANGTRTGRDEDRGWSWEVPGPQARR